MKQRKAENPKTVSCFSVVDTVMENDKTFLDH